MKKLISLLLSLALLGSISALGYDAADFQGGEPSGITAAADGSILVTDTFNKVVWSLKDGTATIAAGQIAPADLSGEPIGLYEDATLATALFMEPWDIVPFLEGYAVSDSSANVVRIVLKDKVQTLTGSGKEGNADGYSIKAQFSHPTGLAVDENNNLYIADTGNNCIRIMTEKGDVTTWCAGLSEPTGICWHDGSLYVAETGRSRIIKITDGIVTPIAGTTETLDGEEYTFGFTDGKIASARFNHPQGILVNDDGTIYVADTDNHAVREIADGSVTTLAVSRDEPTAPISPRGMLLSGDTLYVCDNFAQTILEVSLAEKTFPDVGNTWYTSSVNAAVKRGYISGTASGLFVPGGETTRAAFVSMLANVQLSLDGSEVINGDATFTDVKTGDWYCNAVKWAADAKIVSGSTDGTFSPLKSASREQIAVMLMQYAQYLGMDTSKRADLSSYTDADAIHSWALDAMQWAVAEGVISGNTQSQLMPRSSSTRAQTVCMLMNFMSVAEA